MATKNFTQFNTASPLTTSDYIVGYNAAGTAEIKTQVQSILNLKSDSDAQTLLYNIVNKELSISSGNTVSLSSQNDYPTTLTSSSSYVGLYDNFENYTDGSTLSGGVTIPQIGNVWRVKKQYTTDNPIISGGTLYAAPSSLLYLGTQVLTPGKVFSLNIEFEVRATPFPNGIFNNLIAMAFNSTPVMDLSSTITPYNSLHMGFSTTGPEQIDFFQTGIIPTRVDKNNNYWTDGSPLALNRRYTMRFEIEGNEFRVIFLGKVFRWQHPDMSTKFGRDGAFTYFYYEPGGEFATGIPGTQSRTKIYLHKIWANAPRLDVTPGWGSDTYSGLLQNFAGGSSNVEIPINLIDTSTESWWYNPNQITNNKLAVKGSIYAEGRIRARLGQFENIRNIPITYDTVASNIVGNNAGGALTTLKSSNWVVPPMPVGAVENILYWGAFANNNNEKRIIIDSAAPWFTTGPLSANGIPWELQICRIRRPSVSHGFYFKFTTTTTTILSVVDWNPGDIYLPYTLQGSGVATNDVMLYGGVSQVNYSLNS